MAEVRLPPMYLPPEVQISVIDEKNFTLHLPDYIQRVGTKLTFDPAKVNVFMDALEINGFKFELKPQSEVKCKTEEDFAIISERLLMNPIILKAEVERERNFVFAKETITGHYMVTINTQNSIIRSQIESALRELELSMKKGKNIALKMDVTTSIKRWFKSVYPSAIGNFSVEGGEFVITNYSARLDIYYSPQYWLCCLPCCILTGPCYCIHRAIACKDLRREILGATHCGVVICDEENIPGNEIGDSGINPAYTHNQDSTKF